MTIPAAVARDAPDAAGELRGSARLELHDAAPLPWLIPSGVMAHWQSDPDVWPLPGAYGALRGVTYWLGRLAPVFDVAQWLAPARGAAAVGHVVLLALPRGPAALRVSGPPDLVHVGRGGACGTASVVPAPLRDFMHARHLLDGSVVHEFAVESWLNLARTGASATPAGAKEST